MTPNEFQALIVGIALGGAAVNGVYALLAGRGAGRAARRADAAAKQAAGQHFLNGFRLYRISQQVDAVRNRSRA